MALFKGLKKNKKTSTSFNEKKPGIKELFFDLIIKKTGAFNTKDAEKLKSYYYPTAEDGMAGIFYSFYKYDNTVYLLGEYGDAGNMFSSRTVDSCLMSFEDYKTLIERLESNPNYKKR